MPRTATVVCGVTLPDGTVYHGQNVTVRLNVDRAFTSDGATEIVRTAYAEQTPTGFRIAGLVINDDIDPAGSAYTVRVASGLVWTFQLTAAHAGLEVRLRDVIVGEVGTPPALVAGITQAQLDAALAAFTPTTTLDGGTASSTTTGNLDGGSAAA